MEENKEQPAQNNTQPIQTTQIENNPQPQDHMKDLDDYQKIAIERRLASVPYKIIQRELKELGRELKENTIRDWFDRQGSCHAAFIFKQKELIANREIVKATEEKLLTDGIVEAIGVIRQAQTDPTITETQIRAAENILDRTGYPKQTKTTGSMQVESESMKVLAESMRAIAQSGAELPKDNKNG